MREFHRVALSLALDSKGFIPKGAGLFACAGLVDSHRATPISNHVAVGFRDLETIQSRDASSVVEIKA
jgi:hypothetical protein